MQNVYIVANHICKVNIDINDDYDIVVKSISGTFRTPVFKKGDYIKYIGDNGTIQTFTIGIDSYTQLINSSIESMFSLFLAYNESMNQWTYKVTITDCSTRLQYILGISKFPAKEGEVTQSVPFGNGPSYLCVTCDKLTGSGVIMPNVYMIDNVFQIQGPGFSGNDFHNLTFTIRGLYNEVVEMDSDLLWHFELSKSEKSQNRHFRFTNQYR